MRRHHYIRIYGICTRQPSAQAVLAVFLLFSLPLSPKSFVSPKKHFLIGKDFSCLKFILPNMDHEMGGGCS